LKKCISKGANINVEDKKKWTPLIWSACKGYIDITRYLISLGAHE
jgi:ankyrin repeat protein